MKKPFDEIFGVIHLAVRTGRSIEVHSKDGELVGVFSPRGNLPPFAPDQLYRDMAMVRREWPDCRISVTLVDEVRVSA